MASRKWAIISNGATFEALVNALISFEDANAAFFFRPGKDGGQDARSGDGTIVYQAKHHADASAAKAIADAKQEALKIAKYRTPGHSRHSQWSNVRHWRLVTNALFNTTNRQTWDDEVVPQFRDLGLTADYWEQATLDALLDKHPEVDRSYFENEPRAFLSLPEAYERMRDEEPFLRRATVGELYGRTSELDRISDFLTSDKRYIVVHGAGGVGKSRLLLEAGSKAAASGEWQVLWANPASMMSGVRWFDSIVPERATILIVDEPDDDKLLQVLSEQLRSRVGRAQRWKVAVAVRSPKNPVLRFMFSPRIKRHVEELPLNPLEVPDSLLVCEDLLDSGVLSTRSQEWKANASNELARRFGAYPLWLTLAIHLLEEGGDLGKLPNTSEAMADIYLAEILKFHDNASETQVLRTLRCLALLGTVSREDNDAMTLLASNLDPDARSRSRVEELLRAFVARRVLVERGARRRLVEIKPDILRDHILIGWLLYDTGHGDQTFLPSEDARGLIGDVCDSILQGTVPSLLRSILTSLARTDLLLQLDGRPVAIIDSVFESIHDGLSNTTASKRITIAKVLADIAFVRPAEAVRLSRALRSSPCDTESMSGIMRDREVGKDDIVLELAWAIMQAAMGAHRDSDRAAVLDELFELTEAEAGISTRRKSIPNDGKRAAQLLIRTIHGGPQFWGDFSVVAKNRADRELAMLSTHFPSPERAQAVRALVSCLTSLERMQIWGEGWEVRIQTEVVSPGQPAWEMRDNLLSQLKTLIVNPETPPASRILGWKLLAEAHNSANVCRKHHSEAYLLTVLADLTWAQPVVRNLSGNLEELSVARSLWEWHFKYEKTADIKVAADALEDIYRSNALIDEFEALVSTDGWQQKRETTEKCAVRLIAAGSADAITSFLERAELFFTSRGDAHPFAKIAGVAWELGLRATATEFVRDFIKSEIARSEPTMRDAFVGHMATAWVDAERSRLPESGGQLAIHLVALAGSSLKKIDILWRLYSVPPSRSIGNFIPEEWRQVRSLGSMFADYGKEDFFIGIVGWTFSHDWPEYRHVIESLLNDASVGDIAHLLAVLVDSIYWGLHDSLASPPPDTFNTWLLDQLMRMPNMDDLGDNMQWHIGEILKQIGGCSLEWIVDALKRRSAQELNHVEGIRAFGYHHRITGYMTPLSASDVSSPLTREAIASLLELASDKGTIGFYFEDIVKDIDPLGMIIPDMVVESLASITDHDALSRLARIASAYPEGSPSWRKIARSVLERASHTSGNQETIRLYSALAFHGIETWMTSPGKPAKKFYDAVDSAKMRLASEAEASFRPFWEWSLRVAEERLRNEEERAKEDLGE